MLFYNYLYKAKNVPKSGIEKKYAALTFTGIKNIIVAVILQNIITIV